MIALSDLKVLTDAELDELVEEAIREYGERRRGRLLDLLRYLTDDDVVVLEFSTDEWDDGYFYVPDSARATLTDGSRCCIEFDEDDEAEWLGRVLNDLGSTFSLGAASGLVVNLRAGEVVDR